MKQAAFFDRTSRGRLIVTGRDRKDLLHRLCTNDVASLKEGESRATCFCNRKGLLIDWSVVIDRGEDILILTANPQRLSGHIQQYTITEDVTVRNYMALELVVCGPDAAEVLGVELEESRHETRRLAEVEVLIARIEPLWTDGYAVLAPDAVALRRLLAKDAKALDVAEIDELRIRSGMPAFPNEINESRNPWEAALEDSISMAKGCYVGQEVVARLKTYNKVKKRLVGLQLEGPFSVGAMLSLDSEEVGEVTSLSGDVALGYLHLEHSEPGTQLDRAKIVALPMS
ncbi:MAG: hypothetical protein V3T86_09735 [Planctomycetota bacterium]